MFSEYTVSEWIDGCEGWIGRFSYDVVVVVVRELGS